MAVLTVCSCRIPLVLTLLLLGLLTVQGQLESSEMMEDKDGWGMWSDYTECSRSCGGGIQTSTRRCISRSSRYLACQGHSIKYQSCNTQPCPEGSMNYRAYQCRAYNGVRYTIGQRDQTFTWTPYYEPTSPCKLICINQFGDTKQLRRTVIYGTHCDNGDRFGVCVRGVCKHVGCDHKIGSVKAEDKCLVCGGTGERCETVTGSTLNKVLQVEEANQIVAFPEGATKLSIEFSTMSPSLLELEASNGRSLKLSEAIFVFGKHKMADFGGTIFKYMVNDDVMKFTARGPLNDTLNLKLRFQGLSPLVEYEYSIKREPQRDSPELSRYKWAYGGWTSCSAECGVGYQLRMVRCMDRETGSAADPSLCQRDLMPDRKQTCSNSPCQNSEIHGYKWVPGRWGNCSEPCGVGEHTQEMRCVESGSFGDPIVVSNELCSRYVGRKPVFKRACQGDGDECPYWATGAWDECSVTCGYGRQTRRLYCQQDIADPESPPRLLDFERCKEEEKPSDVRMCELDPCLDGSNRDKDVSLTFITSDDETRVNVDCILTRFGCCPDQVTPAKGYNYHGCVDRIITSSDPCEMDKDTGPCAKYVVKWYYNDTKKDCLRFWYGGCEGNKNRFPDKRSCRMKCAKMAIEESLPTRTCHTGQYGCCDDGITFARGPDKAGCPEMNRIVGGCAGTRHGCCEDGVTSARGPNRYGCPETRLVGGCRGTRHGCCEDGVTSARGPNRYGCPETRLIGGCGGTRYGCCSDGVTAARGPNLLGCAQTNVIINGCRGTRYGCCADGVTAARGEKFLGCAENPYGGCASSVYGCCDDKVTFAQGPDMRGCPESKPKSCQESSYGCCPDQVTEADRDRSNCLPFDPAWCGIPKDSGNCTRYAMNWYFNVEYGICSRFYYGGCFGNANRFSSKEMCEAKCIHLEGKDVCRLPLVKGPCRSMKRRFYFNASTGQCQLFDYGGCHGNKNNFETMEQCQAACVMSETREISVGSARMPCESQPCQNGFSCQDYRNGTYSCSCNPDWGANCERPPSYWCFSDYECGSGMKCVRDRRCNNGFCHIYAMCTAASQSFTCDRPLCPSSQDCINDATFENGYFCIDKVQYERPSRVILSCTVSRYGCCPDQRTAASGPNYQGCGVQRCENTQYGCCQDGVTVAEGPGYEGCDTVDGSGEVPCEQTVYGCCEDGVTAAAGPGGRGCEEGPDSEDREYIVARRTTTEAPTTMAPAVAPCTAPPHPKLCTKFTPKWHYNTETQRCKRAWWGGCADNGNVFETEEECAAKCINKGTDEGETDFVNICDMNVDNGPCRDDMRRFYYNKRDRSCQGFLYGGCQGNENNFGTLEDCQRECMDGVETVVTTQAPVAATVPPPQSRVNLRISGDNVVDQDGELNIQCQPTGREQVRLEWTFNGNRLPDSEYLTLDGYGQVAKLKITRVGQENAGVYSCRSSDGQEESLRVQVRGREVVRPTIIDGKNVLSMSGDSVVESGTQFILSCISTGPNKVRFDWFFNGQPIQGSENIQMSVKSAIIPGGYSQTSEVVIVRASQDTAGTYYCRTSDRQLKTMVVTIKQTVKLELSGESVVKAGDEIKLTCSAESSVQVELEWYFNGRPLDDALPEAKKGNSSPNWYSKVDNVIIENARREHSGTYYCRVNGGKYKRIVVTVQDEVKTTEAPVDVESTITMNGSASVLIGETISIRCRGVGPRRPSRIEWYINAKAVKADDNDRLKITSNVDPQARNAFISTLEIENAEKDDSAAFYCRQFPYGEYKVMTVKVVETREIVTPRPVITRPTVEDRTEESNDPKEVCTLPKVIGRCRAAHRRWYYDYKSGKCQQFIYGGCEGNKNNFETEQECQNFCSAEVVCNTPKYIGRCRAALPRFYFDAESKSCRQFIFGGCEPKPNNFESQSACEEKCADYLSETTTTSAPDTSSYVCELTRDKGTCRGYNIVWYYSAARNRCSRFIYTGCDGNGNRFDTEEACNARCLKEETTRSLVRPTYRPIIRETTTESNVVPEVGTSGESCLLPRDRGSCAKWTLVWYYDSEKARCLRFYYGGCGGNTNRFDNEEDCLSTCDSSRRRTTTTYVPVTRRPNRCQYTVFGCCPDGVTVSLDSLQSNCRDANVIVQPGGERDRQKVLARPGSVVFLTCSIGRGQDITWYRDGFLLSPETSRKIRIYNNGTLEIYAITERDTGDYSCKTFYGNNIPQLQRFIVEINVPLSILPGPALLSIRPGEDAFLHCQATGNPAPRVSWSKNGRVITSNGRYRAFGNGTLIIESPRQEDTGDYECTAENGVDASVSRRIKFSIRESIRADIQSHGGTYMEGETITLICNGRGYPTPRVEWMKDGRVLTSEGNIFVRGGELQVRSAGIEDSGLYVCSASNGLTSTKDYTTVHIKTHTADTKCTDSMGKYKCLRIVASRLCYVNPFRQSCCDTCRRKGFRS